MPPLCDRKRVTFTVRMRPEVYRKLRDLKATTSLSGSRVVEIAVEGLINGLDAVLAAWLRRERRLEKAVAELGPRAPKSKRFSVAQRRAAGPTPPPRGAG